jgi:hypothetical protein
MALPASGAIRMGADIGVELGNTATSMISIGATAPRALAGVPSGAIRVAADFYGKASAFSFTISANQQQANLRTLALAAGWNGTSVVTATVNAGVYIWSDVTGIAALTIDGSWPNGVTLINNGYIIGKGGNGGSNLQQNVNTSIKPGGNGGSAMSLSINNLIIVNNSGAFIAGGGGGGGSGGFYSPSSVSWAGSGGGGAGGGSGGYTQNTFFVNAPGGNGGSVGTSGSDGTALEAATSIGSGGGGGRILPGTGGQGGFYGSVSSNQGFGRGGGAGGGGGHGYVEVDGATPTGVGGTGGSANNVGGNSTVDLDPFDGAYDQAGNGGGGGGWGASGGTGTQGGNGPSPGSTWSGGSGGKAIALNGYTATIGGSGTIYGAIS